MTTSSPYRPRPGSHGPDCRAVWRHPQGPRQGAEHVRHHRQQCAGGAGADAAGRRSRQGSSLSARELEAINLSVSEHSGCDYCVAAHTMIAKLAGYTAEETRQLR